MRMLEHAGLVTVVEDSIDADVISLERLVSPPAPDVPLAACRRLGVQPEETVLITHSVAGAAAGCAAGLAVVGIGEDASGTLLGRAAERVAPSLRSLLDPRLVGSPANAAVDPAARR